MPSKSSKPGYYAVKNGRNIGIYNTWAECEAQTKGYNGARFKKFSTFSEAQHFISPQSSQSSTAFSQPSASQSSTPSFDKGKKGEFGVEVEDTTGWDIVYSDGACKGNGKIGSIAGVGVWWGPNDERNIAERCPGDQTNNRAELIAIMRVLETTLISKKPLLIRTDSQYCMNCFKNWIHNWRENNWKTKEGEPVKNAGIIRCVSAYMNIRAMLGQKVLLEYVKGHSGDVGNDGADLMANRGSTMPDCPDRNWQALEAELEEQLHDMHSGNQTNVMIPEILGLTDGLATPPAEHRNKIRQLLPQDSPALASSSPSKTATYNHIRSQPPLVAVPASAVNFDDFADCLLDDDDLADELSD